MEIILSLSAIDILSGDVRPEKMSDETYGEIFRAISSAYDEYAGDTEAYLSPMWTKDEFIFGVSEPETLLARVHAWNREIQEEFVRSLDAVCHISETNRLPVAEEIHMDTSETYALAGAAREVDNQWYAFAEHAIYMENEMGYPYFRVILTEEQIQIIEQSPENFVIFNATVKC